MAIDTFQLDDVLRLDFVVSDPADGSITDADSLPSIEIYEDGGTTAVRTPTPAKRDTGTTGQYTFSDTLSAANGYEIGKTYNVYALATVGVAGGALIATFTIRTAIVYVA